MFNNIDEIEVREIGSINMVDITIYYTEGTIENYVGNRQEVMRLELRLRNQKIKKIIKNK